MRTNHRTRGPGFTLVETLIAIVIVVILASVAFVVASRARESAKNAATLNILRQIGAASAAWMGDNGNFYPPCWDNTEGNNRSYAQTLDPYMHGEDNYRQADSRFIGPNHRLDVEVNEYSHPITFSMNRAVCRDITARGRVTEKLIHATQVLRPADIILLADGCQNPSNLNQANASAYRVHAETGDTGPRGGYDDPIPVGPDEDTPAGDGWFRYPGGKCNALMCDGSARSFKKGEITNGNLWIDRVRN